MTRDPLEDLMEHPAHIPDDGFTLRVMAALPPRRSPALALDRWLPLLAAGVVAAALAPDLAELGGGLATSALGAGQAATRAVAAATAGAGLQGALTLVVALAAAAAALGSWLVTARS